MDTNTIIAYFISWENHSRDTIDFKKIYVDMAGDLIAGLVLSQVVYWHLPGDSGITRLRVDKDGHKWIAKKRDDWWKEIRVSAKQLDRALEILEEKNLVVTGLYGFAGTPTKHVRLNWEGFLSAWQAILTDGENATFLPLGKMHFDQRVNSNTETTTETTDNPASPEPAKSKAERMLGQRHEPVTPLVQAELKKYSNARPPLHNLESYLGRITRGRNNLLPYDMAEKLAKPIIVAGHEWASPAETYELDAMFAVWVQEKIAWWQNNTDMDKGRLINLICKYDGPYGWVTYREKIEAENEQPDDDRDIPGMAF